MKGIEQFVQVDAATLGALKYAGTWNASTNTPTLASGVGVQGQYYVVSVAGTTNLDGVTNWGVGDWAVFNGTVWQRVEGGADGNFVNLSVTGTATVSGTAEFADGLAASPSITNIGDTNTGMYFPSADAIGIVTGGVNRIRITSAGDVGIGTTSPAQKLDVANGFVIVGANSANPGVGGNVRLRDDTGAARWLSGLLGGAGATAYSIYDIVAGAERMLIDSAGNLGLGITPSAASLPTIQSAYGLFTGNVEAHISKNAYYNSGWKYAITAPAARYSVGEGDSGYRWYQAGSGTAGNAISFTQSMMLDSNGNLLVGTTASPNSKLNVYGGALPSSGNGVSISSDLLAGRLISGPSQRVNAISTYYDDYAYEISAGSTSGFVSGVVIGAKDYAGTGGDTVSFYTRSAERARIDGSGDFIVGGTTTNSIRLTAEKSNPTRGIIAHVVNSGSSSLTGSQIMFTQNTVNNWAVGQPAGVDAFAFWSSRNTAADGTERMRIDSSGNLGLGVTPSAWSSYKALQVNTGATLASTVNQMVLGSNWSFDGSDRYITSDYSTIYIQNSGQHKWFTAPSGTAGNAISFTQAMTLDASGNLGIGTTSPSSFGIIVAKKDQTADTAISVSNQGTANAATSMSFTLNEAGTPQGWLRRYRDGTGNTEVGFSGALLFTGNVTGTKAERARIDSSGNLLVGKTTASGTTVGPELLANGQINAATADLDNLNIYNTTATAYRFYVNAAGTVFATNTTISAISDQRLKENVQDLDAGLDKIMALKPRKFDWKAGKGKDIKGDRGFIAQEFEQVFPDLIDEWKDPALEGEEPYKSVRQDLIPVLVKAIQELKAEVDSLKAQLGA